jgi:hypothetical protein
MFCSEVNSRSHPTAAPKQQRGHRVGEKAMQKFFRRPKLDTSDVGCVQLAKCRGKAIPSARPEEDGACQTQLREVSLTRVPDNDDSACILKATPTPRTSCSAMRSAKLCGKPEYADLKRDPRWRPAEAAGSMQRQPIAAERRMSAIAVTESAPA